MHVCSSLMKLQTEVLANNTQSGLGAAETAALTESKFSGAGGGNRKHDKNKLVQTSGAERWAMQWEMSL
ncbi:unnamed protein product [Ceratitis capitata]|uniref:(Mediterranean fruit fly) hypothetical protein n=1 Tax=Ceratitis capitata TaxID=7213 RepID=A0A811VEU5_CERCA|nr:unnamed protein product [Ceratitis capitata]